MKQILVRALALILFALGAFGNAANASILHFSIAGTGSGSLGGTAFTDAAFTIDLVGDTAHYNGANINPLDSASMTIAGLGTTEFLIGTYLGETGGGIVYFTRAAGSDLFDFTLAAPVDLVNPFGPVLGTGVFALNQFINVDTSLGLLSVSASSDVQFQAVEAPVGGVPVPATVLLISLGLLSVRSASRRLRMVR